MNDNNNINTEAAELVRLTQDLLRHQSNLPPGVLQRLYDMAGTGVTQAATTQRQYHGRDNDSTCYFRVAVQTPLSPLLFVPRKLVIVTHSRDQGWSSYPDDQGTRRGSWTWVNLQLQQQQQRGGNHEQLYCTRLVTNIHAGEDWERTERVFSQGDTTLDVLASALEDNDGSGSAVTINLYTHSCYPGWNCRMNGAEVRVLWTPNVQAIADQLHNELTENSPNQSVVA